MKKSANNDFHHQQLPEEHSISEKAVMTLRRAYLLELAERYDDAAFEYNLALEYARESGDSVINWPPAMIGLENVKKKKLTQEHFNKAQSFMLEDNWAAALEQFRIVQNISENSSTEHSIAKEKISILQKAKELERRIKLMFENTDQNQISEVFFKKLESAEHELRLLQENYFESKLLSNYYSQIILEQQTRKKKILIDIKALLQKAKLSYSLSRKRAYINQASEILSSVQNINFLANDYDIVEMGFLITEEAKNLSQIVTLSFEQEEQYKFYESQLQEELLDNPSNPTTYFFLEWIQARRRRLEKENLRIKEFNRRKDDLNFESKVWFFASIITAGILFLISVYIILSTFRNNDPITSLTSLLSLIPVLASKLVYDQAQVAHQRAENIRKEQELERERNLEIEKLEFQTLQNKVLENPTN